MKGMKGEINIMSTIDSRETAIKVMRKVVVDVSPEVIIRRLQNDNAFVIYSNVNITNTFGDSQKGNILIDIITEKTKPEFFKTIKNMIKAIDNPESYSYKPIFHPVSVKGEKGVVAEELIFVRDEETMGVLNELSESKKAIYTADCVFANNRIIDYVRNNSHYHVAIYTNPDMIERYYKGLEKEYNLWLAYWTKINPKEHYAYQIWQRGTIKINGKTFDENVCVKDYDAYPDIKGKWYQKAAKWCIDNGVMVGYGDELFHGDDICTRGMLAQALYNLNNK